MSSLVSRSGILPDTAIASAKGVGQVCPTYHYSAGGHARRTTTTHVSGQGSGKVIRAAARFPAGESCSAARFRIKLST